MATKTKKTKRKKSSYKSRTFSRRPGGASPRHQKAIALLTQAVLLHKKEGRLVEAEALFLRVLEIEPTNPVALVRASNIAIQRKDWARAEEFIKKAIEAEPSFASHHNSLGFITLSQGRKQEAFELFKKAIELDPDFGLAYANAGAMLNEKNELKEAEKYLEKALELIPDKAYILENLGLVYVKLKKKNEALQCFEGILKIAPENAQANHFAAALRGESPETAPAGYVEDLFDKYADGFDEHLAKDLRYRVPELVREAVGRVAGPGGGDWKVLDLGCGTGLSGELFRDLAGHMAGVDLSPKMAEKAGEKNVYDTIEIGDLTSSLEKYDGDLDLTVSADVLIYVGDLDQTFEACQGALREGGLFAFSIESFGGEGYFLRDTGRYAHAPGYIQEMAEKYEFSILLTEEVVLRIDKHKPIAGIVYVLCKGERVPASEEDQKTAIGPEKIDDVYQTAILQHQAGHLKEAGRHYREILDCDPGHTDSLLFLGVIAHQTGDNEKAAKLIEQAIEIKPDVSFYHTNLGIVLLAQGNITESEEAFNKALQIDPDNAQALFNLSNVLKLQGRMDEAENHAVKTLQLQPSFAEGHKHLGNLLAAKGQMEEAHICYSKAVELNPEYTAGLLSLANFLKHQGEQEEAARYYRRLLTLEPGTAGARESLDECLAIAAE